MPIDWTLEEEDEARLAFERAALDAAQGYIETLDKLRDALAREEKLKAQIAALVGLDKGDAQR